MATVEELARRKEDDRNRGRNVGRLMARLVSISLFLQDRDAFTAREMAEHLGVTQGTISVNYLPALEEFGWVYREDRYKWSSLLVRIELLPPPTR